MSARVATVSSPSRSGVSSDHHHHRDVVALGGALSARPLESPTSSIGSGSVDDESSRSTLTRPIVPTQSPSQPKSQFKPSLQPSIQPQPPQQPPQQTQIDMETEDSWLQPSSTTRKKRRFAIYISIFNNASRCSDVVYVDIYIPSHPRTVCIFVCISINILLLFYCSPQYVSFYYHGSF